ncbi:hypothetical protein ACFQL7_27625 [Halocatena marina]|uniref:Uncharacterized protein n=1 Tax=Halocatena marina TaxID=2934937 RepID=A0ABD5YXP5_9EURY
MARPKIDLPKYLIGGVDDYADREGIERDEAWKQIIREGLNVEQVEGFYEKSGTTEE